MENLGELLGKYMSGSITEAERENLSGLVTITPDELLLDELEAVWDKWQPNNFLNEEASLNILQNILYKKQAPIKKLYTRWWMVAASIAVLLGLAAWWIFYKNKPSTDHQKTMAVSKDVPAPTNTRAVITLANGSKIYLDSAGSGVLAKESGVDLVRNENGEIRYQPMDNNQQTILYNTISNPRGSKIIPLILSDGTKVWLNSESSLTYPVAFNTNNRQVEVSGEAYFEVAHDASKPFHVKKREADITVLGTHFNVYAYDDEDVLKVTLLEGSVRVTTEDSKQRRANSIVIQPGQQAVYSANSQMLTTTSSVDLDQVMAWKNNEFFFHDADINAIMRQLSRWYDIKATISAPLQNTYTGRITRSVPLSEVLKMFEKVGYVKFEINGNTVHVMPTQ